MNYPRVSVPISDCPTLSAAARFPSLSVQNLCHAIDANTALWLYGVGYSLSHCLATERLDFYCDHVAFYTMIYYFAITEDFQLVNTNGINCEIPPARLLALHRTQRPYITHVCISPVAHLKKGDLEIDVILSASASPLELIAAFWATQVQNIPTPDFICVSYPALNEGDVALLTPAQLVNTQFPSGKTLDLIRKYEAQDFLFAVRPMAIQGGFCGGQWAATYPTAVRFFGDKHCLLLHMSPVGVAVCPE
ncbi:hypothetical protein LXA43DRAFT_1091642 [Ganoderma leucocontextum]|nr:hypothetical protein LXA43DRAFT_1091642 [Ganoderma leucocontextum]